jgi:hypothetical protein
MKQCVYCGRENEDEATTCKECWGKLETANDDPKSGGSELRARSPKRRSKVRFIVAAFTVAMLAMFPLVGLLSFQPLLILAVPSGLRAFFEPADVNWKNTTTGWLLYAAEITALMLTRRRAWFVALYIVLCLMLAANVAGCYQVANGDMRDLN